MLKLAPKTSCLLHPGDSALGIWCKCDGTHKFLPHYFIEGEKNDTGDIENDQQSTLHNLGEGTSSLKGVTAPSKIHQRSSSSFSVEHYHNNKEPEDSALGEERLTAEIIRNPEELKVSMHTRKGHARYSKLCRICRGITAAWRKACSSRILAEKHIYYEGPLWDRRSEMEASAHDSCAMCALLLRMYALNKYKGLAYLPSHTFITVTYQASGHSRPACSYMNFESESKLYSLYTSPCNPEHVSYNYLPEGSTNTIDALPFALDWLKECVSSHRDCHPPKSTCLPARMLYLSSDEDIVRIFSTDNLNNTVEYATLSHCWGQAKFLTLKTSNIEDFTKSVPSEALSKTFRDAIRIARFMGLSYLWIDSLCIIQDDEADWLRESSLMSGVYGCSSLNISATGAEDGNRGCFFPRHAFRPCVVKSAQNSIEEASIYMPRYYYEEYIDNLPLEKRGWTLQERLLPRRTLFLTPTEVIWECYAKAACETLPQGFPRDLYPGHLGSLNRESWNSIISSYSRRFLTDPTDKFIAIAGLAAIIQAQTQDQYVAGMWLTNLPEQLCWYDSSTSLLPQAEVEQRRSCTVYIAPSWSWMSTLCAITPDDSLSDQSVTGSQRNKNFIRVVYVDISLAATNPLGAISAGTLRVGCNVLFRLPQSHMESGVQTTRLMYASMPNLQSVMEHLIRFVYDPVIGGEAEIFSTIYLLPIYQTSGEEIKGLILRATGNANGQYRRIGIFDLSMLHSKRAHSDKILTENKEMFYPKESEFVELDPDESQEFRYILEII